MVATTPPETAQRRGFFLDNKRWIFLCGGHGGGERDCCEMYPGQEDFPDCVHFEALESKLPEARPRLPIRPTFFATSFSESSPQENQQISPQLHMKITSRRKRHHAPSSGQRTALSLATALFLGGFAGTGATTARAVEPVDQGPNWSAAAQADFYTRDQGSQMIKYTWFKALKRPDGQLFLADQLSRYGYLPNPNSPDGLPVGFTKAAEFAGMTCAACHTRQITVDGKDYRIDGGPAIVDVQSYFADLGRAVGDVLASDAAFLDFAKVVIGQPNPDPQEVKQLKDEAKLWFERYDALMSRALPKPSWGPGRLDAVGMIFNRLTGLDLGPAPAYIIAGNIKPADAPVRYPFLWNASIQDHTQWPGFAKNGNDVLGLARNLGEVYGVFGTFVPKKEWWHPLGVNYVSNNSANFDGLGRLEDLIKKIGPPVYPWPVDAQLAAKGKAIFERAGSCASCHGIEKNFLSGTWKTPLQDVKTDSREYDVLNRVAATGVLEGKGIPFIVPKLDEVDTAFHVLEVSVIGAITQNAIPFALADVHSLADKAITDVAPHQLARLDDARQNFRLPARLRSLETAYTDATTRLQTNAALAAPADPFPYESRVMQGIWAAAPYLHNGSVPTLAALLEHRDKRPSSFKIGPNYDIKNLGLATDQSKFGDQTLVTSGDRNSGNYNGGHEEEGKGFGTELSDDEKKALLEYLKTL